MSLLLGSGYHLILAFLLSGWV